MTSDAAGRQQTATAKAIPGGEGTTRRTKRKEAQLPFPREPGSGPGNARRKVAGWGISLKRVRGEARGRARDGSEAPERI